MENDKPAAQILAMPYQMIPWDQLGDCDIDVLSAQLRICGVEQIRLVQAGRLQPDESLMRNLNQINGLLAEFGKPTMVLDFI
ncbi:hypothetical protein [Mucilaginibacter sp.]|uniref:hypothetical protein n=1 Tax=Mucilaginibacter sp. TaxID=1882438 RepID=UPI0025DAC1FA|nr:hypothetical protein [Mucilaginibacter sp.]